MDSAPRRYWQLPMFVLGVAAMAAAYRQFPPPAAMAGDAANANVTAVQAALVAKPNGWESVKDRVRTLEVQLDATQPVPSAAAFAVGSWHVSAAEYGKASEATKHWEQAALRFQQVDLAALDTADAGRFAYRNAKIDAMRQAGKPNETLFALLNAPQGEDTTFRGLYAYATAMRLTPPDTARARPALAEFLSGPGAAKLPALELAQSKYKLGELLVNDGQFAEARPWLDAATGPAADTPTRARAHLMLGRVGESLRDTKLAIGGYQQAVAVKNLPDADAATIRMLAGEGLARLDLPGDAAVAFAQASQDRGPIGIAAACRLAHMNAKNPSLAGHRKADVETLAKCVAAVKPTGELDNPHVTIDDLRTTCETVIRACVNDGDEASAQQAMGLFEKVGSPARAREVKADALQTLAYATANKPDPSNKAAALHRQAAAEFDALAAASLTPALKVDAMVKAANSFVAAGDRTAARDRLSEIANLPGLPAEQLASIRTSLAETVADPAQAATLLQQVVESGGAAAYAARVKLGEVKLDQANALIGKFADPAVKTQWDRMTAEAATLLEQAATATTVAPADQPAHERAMYLLGRLKLYQGKHSESIGTLKSLLQRYPNAKDAERAKLFLGSSLLVEGTTAPGNAATVTEAIAMLEPLAAGAKDSYVRTQAGLRVARGHLAGGRWQEAITAATATADGSKGTVEELIALSLAYNAYAEQKRPEQLTVVEGRMRQVFQELPETAFNGSADEYRAGYWKTTWFDFFDKKKSP